MKKISIIVSVYNEESALRQFYGSRSRFLTRCLGIMSFCLSMTELRRFPGYFKGVCGPGSEGEAGEFLQELRP